MNDSRKIAVIGGGAAGFFGAITCASANPKLNVTIFEKSGKLLSKVRISGGGRCNVTNNCTDISELIKNYPRGGRELRGAFSRFGPSETMQWFEERGVKLKTEDDRRVFPESDQSSSIVNCLLHEAERTGVKIITGKGVKGIQITSKKFTLSFDDQTEEEFDDVLITTGGSPTADFYHWIEKAGHTIQQPVPSLFTFNLSDKKITRLMGVSLPNVKVSIEGSKSFSEGPLLVTHWGLSGPAILKLSSHCAREIAEKNYKFHVVLNWINSSEAELREHFAEIRKNNPRKTFRNISEFDFPKRFWEYLLEKTQVDPEKQNGQSTREEMNRLVAAMYHDKYEVSGKTTFKEEFVTCGGVDLSEINFKKMESRLHPHLHFAGEVLDIDAVTGGFNFQAAWTGAYIAGMAIAEREG